MALANPVPAGVALVILGSLADQLTTRYGISKNMLETNFYANLYHMFGLNGGFVVALIAEGLVLSVCSIIFQWFLSFLASPLSGTEFWFFFAGAAASAACANIIHMKTKSEQK